jgi:hypothetical protein
MRRGLGEEERRKEKNDFLGKKGKADFLDQIRISIRSRGDLVENLPGQVDYFSWQCQELAFS